MALGTADKIAKWSWSLPSIVVTAVGGTAAVGTVSSGSGPTSDQGQVPSALLSVTTGFDEGAILRPWTRFPGQTSYTQVSANILVDASGDFTWQRRTGKKIYVSVRSQDGSVISNRIIIPSHRRLG